mgnify:CR=1 FL=1
MIDLFAKDFFAWSGTFAVDYSTNDTYQADNELTWNFSDYRNSVDNSALPGYWRGIYKQIFNTDAPHSRPWEIFDFTKKKLILQYTIGLKILIMMAIYLLN